MTSTVRARVTMAAGLIMVLAAGALPAAAQATGARRPARQAPAKAPREITRVTSLRAEGQARITGFVVTRDAPPQPVTHAKVRARHQTGRVVGTTTTDSKGAFAFWIDEPDSYYLELVDDENRVLAVEDVGETAVTVAAGQVSTTIIRVPGALVAGWSNTAKAILGAAAATGVGAVVASGQPASPER